MESSQSYRARQWQKGRAATLQTASARRALLCPSPLLVPTTSLGGASSLSPLDRKRHRDADGWVTLPSPHGTNVAEADWSPRAGRLLAQPRPSPLACRAGASSTLRSRTMAAGRPEGVARKGVALCSHTAPHARLCTEASLRRGPGARGGGQLP